MMRRFLILLFILLGLVGCNRLNSPKKIEERELEAKILKCEFEKSQSGDLFLKKLLFEAKERKDVGRIKRVLIAYGRIRKPSNLEYILPFLKYKNYEIRAIALFAIGEILRKENRKLFFFSLSPNLKKRIAALFSDPSIVVRSSLVESLGKIGDDCGMDIGKYFFYKKNYSDLEIYFLHQLLKTTFRLKRVDLIPKVVEYLSTGNKNLLFDALFTLRILLRIKGEKISLSSKLLKKLEGEKNVHVFSSFIRLLPYLKLSEEIRLNILRRVLNGKNPGARIEAIRVIGLEKRDKELKLLVSHFKRIFDPFAAFPKSERRKNLNEILEVLKALRGYRGHEWKKVIFELFRLYPYFRIYFAISYLSSFSDRDNFFLLRCRNFPVENHYLSWVRFLSSSDRREFNLLALKIFKGITGYNVDINWILSGRVIIAENLLQKEVIDPLEVVSDKYSPVRELALYEIGKRGREFLFKNRDVILSGFKKYIFSNSVGDKLAFISVAPYCGEEGRSILLTFLKNKNYIVRLKSAFVLKKYFNEDHYWEIFSHEFSHSFEYYHQTALYEELPIILKVCTSCGNFQLRLYPRIAPFSSENFISLSSVGFYEGNIFHRVVPDFVVQWGSVKGSGYFDSGYTLPSEFSQNFYTSFVLGKANSGFDTSSSQVFITLSPQPHLEGYYTLFGEVIGGYDVVKKISQDDFIEKVKLEYPFFPFSFEVCE